MKAVVTALIFVTGLIAGSDAALAQCAGARPNITALEESEAVFIGEVVDSKVVEKPASPSREDSYEFKKRGEEPKQIVKQ